MDRMERVDLHGIRPVDKRTVGSIQFSARGSKELHAEILHYTYDIHDHCLPRDLARDWVPGIAPIADRTTTLWPEALVLTTRFF